MINKCNWRREGKGKGQREACKTAFEMDRRKGVEKNGRKGKGREIATTNCSQSYLLKGIKGAHGC